MKTMRGSLEEILRIHDNPDAEIRVGASGWDVADAMRERLLRLMLEFSNLTHGKVWVGELQEAFGYGISAIGHSEKEVNLLLMRKWDEVREQYQMPGNDVAFMSYEAAKEYFGMHVREVTIGQAYFGDLGI